MKEIEVNLYHGFIFDNGYTPFYWKRGLAFNLTNQIFIGQYDVFGHELLEMVLRQKVKDRSKFHCEETNCILNKHGGKAICVEHQVYLKKIKHIPFEISLYVYSPENKVSFEEVDSYLQGFKKLTGLKTDIVHFERVNESCQLKYLLISRKCCKLTGKFRRAHNSGVFRLLPQEFVNEFSVHESSQSNAYLFPCEKTSSSYIVDPVVFERFITEGLKRRLITREDIKLRKRLIEDRIITQEAFYEMIRDDEIRGSEDGNPVDKEESMEYWKRKIDGLTRLLNLIETLDSRITLS